MHQPSFFDTEDIRLMVEGLKTFVDTRGSSSNGKCHQNRVARNVSTKFSSSEISHSRNFSPVEKGKEQGKQLKHEQAIVPKQNRKTWAVFEYCTGFFIPLY